MKLIGDRQKLEKSKKLEKAYLISHISHLTSHISYLTSVSSCLCVEKRNKINPMNTLYPITGVGLGPGDPDLITVKGLRMLQLADVIFYPATSMADGRASSF